MSRSSYDELMKQVMCLKMENSHLRQELEDNSSHLTKLENDASNMKDVLTHINTAVDSSHIDGATGDSSGDTNFGLAVAMYPDYQTPPPKCFSDTLDHNSNSSSGEF